MSDAMGQSRLERFYAFVETKEGDLGEQLVRNGLARSYGFKAAPPGLTSSRIEVEKLQQFEDEAKRAKIGAWGVNAGRLNVHAQPPSSFSAFVPEEKTRSRSVPADSPAVFSPNCEISRVGSAQQSSRDNCIAREGKDSTREHRHQHCDRKRANDGAGNRACDGGAHYRPRDRSEVLMI